jgi:hypothetical protein
MNDADRRKLMSLAFEPEGEAYLYYRNRWSRGVRVSAAEREAFVSSGVVDAMRLARSWSRRVPVAPRRHPGLWFMLDAMPRRVGFSCLGLAAVSFAWAVTVRSMFAAIPFALGGAFLALMGGGILVKRFAAMMRRFGK